MRHIIYKGQFESEEQLQRAEIIKGAQELKGGENIGKSIRMGMIVSSPLLLSTLVLAMYLISSKIRTDGIGLLELLATTVIVTLLVVLAIPIHEILHAIWFPVESEKEIWKATSEGAFFIYCTAKIEKKHYIFLSLFPTIVLGLSPFAILLLIYNISSTSIVIGLLIFAIANIYAGVSDYGVVYHIMRQVPRKGIIYNSGMKTYWYSERNEDV